MQILLFIFTREQNWMERHSKQKIFTMEKNTFKTVHVKANLFLEI